MKFLTRAVTALALIVSAGALSAADVTEHQWVRAAEGAVKGRVVVPRGDSISAVRGAKVSLIDQQGKFAAKAVESDNTGRFTLTGVQPGVYTLMIQGEHEFACCAMHVVNSAVPLKSEFEIAAGAVDYTVVRRAMVRYLPAKSSQSQVVFDPTTNPLGSDRAMTGEMIRIAQHDGGLKGRLTRAGFTEQLGAENSNVMIYHDGAEVARTVTDAEGYFSVAKLSPGSYTVLGSGEAGFGVMGLELVDPLAMGTASVDRDQTLVVQAAMPDTFLMQVAPVSTGTIISDRVISEQVIDMGVVEDRRAGAPIGFQSNAGGGIIGGGGGGGGGGIGGGGGLGRLAVLGGIGAAIAIAASDDDDTATPPVASPSTP